MNAAANVGTARRVALDGADRRRIYLFRHGAVDYLDANGNVVPDTDRVDLNAHGKKQASNMYRLFENVQIDKAICSGLPRTRQTAETVVGHRDIEVESYPAFEEIRRFQGEVGADYDVLTDIAFSHWRAPDTDAQFLGGERYSDFFDRISFGIDGLLADKSWHNVAVFAHGGTNAAVLGWVTGLGLTAFGLLDQATCCLNVIDIDVDSAGEIVRKTVRAMNVTVEDPAKGDRHAGDMESLARWMIKIRSNASVS